MNLESKKDDTQMLQEDDSLVDMIEDLNLSDIAERIIDADLENLVISFLLGNDMNEDIVVPQPEYDVLEKSDISAMLHALQDYEYLFAKLMGFLQQYSDSNDINYPALNDKLQYYIEFMTHHLNCL